MLKLLYCYPYAHALGNPIAPLLAVARHTEQENNAMTLDPISRRIAPLLVATLALLCLAVAPAPAEEPIQVGLLMETYDVNRWERDERFFKEKVK